MRRLHHGMLRPGSLPVLLALWLSAGMRAGALTPLDAATNHPGFYFVQVSDPHFGSGDHADRMKRVVEAINDLPMRIECVVVTGDIASDNLDNPRTLAEATSTLARIRAPVHCLPGNHDILPSRFAATLAAWTNAFGPVARRAEYGGVVFLLLDTEPAFRNVTIPGYDPLGWLAAELREAGEKPVIVFHHTPPVEDFYKNRMHWGWRREVKLKWEDLLQSANVRAVVAGHFHRDEMHWLGRVPLYVCAPVAGYWGRPSTFRVYEYRDGKLGYRTVYIED